MYRPVKAGEVFATFIFDGKDCADMGVYSTTSSGTYTMYLEPTFKDETLEVPAYDGRYYYGTQYTAQQFQFNMFADNLSVAEYRNLRNWLRPRNIGKLILSDQPYKYYIVKVSSISALGDIPLTDAQQVVHSILGDSADGNVVYTGNFTVTFQTVGSCYGYGLSYYRDDLVYDALNKFGVNIYPENYYYDSGLLYKDMTPALTRIVPSNANEFKLTVYNPGSASAIPTVLLAEEKTYSKGSYIQLNNNSLNLSTIVDIGGLTGPIEISLEEEVIYTTEEDGIRVRHFGRFKGNQFEIGAETSVITIPESFTQSIEDFYFRDYDSVYIINDAVTGETWAHINPLVMEVHDGLVGQYFCINGNGGALILSSDEVENKLKLDSTHATTHEILPAVVEEDGTVTRPSGMEFNYIGEFNSEVDLPSEGKDGDVASITYTKLNTKGDTIVDRVDMHLYRDGKWTITNLFSTPADFADIHGNFVPKYLIFGATIVDINDITVNTNIEECELSITFLPRYL